MLGDWFVPFSPVGRRCPKGADEGYPTLFRPSWPGLTRPSTPFGQCKEIVDGRVKPGHDDTVWSELP